MGRPIVVIHRNAARSNSKLKLSSTRIRVGGQPELTAIVEVNVEGIVGGDWGNKETP